jgi:hypothetical protein
LTIMLSAIFNRWSNVAGLSWVAVFGLTVLGWLVFGVGLLGLLEFKGRLAPPPLSATTCIDEKVSFLRNRDLSQVRIMGAGSSATWRNLDMSVFGLDPTRALNAAPCFLHIDQTAFLVSLLVEMMPNLQNVITIVAPRDFEDCSPQFTQIFDPALGAAFIQKQIPVWLPYVVNMRAPYILRTEARDQLATCAGLRRALLCCIQELLAQDGTKTRSTLGRNSTHDAGMGRLL